jgi:hypothetical protein
LIPQDAGGVAEGEELTLTVWSAADQSERPLNIQSLRDGLTGTMLQDRTIRYRTNAALIARSVVEGGVPVTFDLMQNYPNPFNPVTVIRFQVPVTTRVLVKVFDVLGREVRTVVDDVQTAGTHAVEFNGTDLASGVYIYKMEAAGYVQQKKLLLLK